MIAVLWVVVFAVVWSIMSVVGSFGGGINVEGNGVVRLRWCLSGPSSLDREGLVEVLYCELRHGILARCGG
jgi:hypothetical protein